MTNNEKCEILEIIGQALLNASHEIKDVTVHTPVTPTIPKSNNNILTGTIIKITKPNKNRNRFINILPDGESRTVGFTINHDYPENTVSNLKILGYQFNEIPTAEYLETMNLNDLINLRVSFILQDDPRYIQRFVKEG